MLFLVLFVRKFSCGLAEIPAINVATNAGRKMAKLDTKKTAKFSVRSQEWSLDITPHKSTKKAKAKERQEGRREISDALREE